MRKAFVPLLLLFLVHSIWSQSDFIIKNYQVTLDIKSSGTIQVQEIIDVRFTEERRGIIRDIQLTSSDVPNHRVRISDINIPNWQSKISSMGGVKSIRIGSPDRYVSGDQKYQINYNIDDVIIAYDDWNELYWNIIGHEWQVPIEASSFSIRYPANWSDSLSQFKVYSGQVGDKSNSVYLSQTSNRITGAITNRLNPEHGVTLALRIPKSYVNGVSIKAATSGNARRNQQKVERESRNWMAIIPIALAGLLMGLYNRNGSRRQTGEVPPLQYYPIENMSPAVVGSFYDNKVNKRDLISMLPYWGQMGYLKMRDINEDETVFEKTAEMEENAPPHEQIFFADLFNKGNRVLLSDLTNSFYQTMSKVSGKIKSEILHIDVYDQASYKLFHTGWMIFAFIVLTLAGIFSIIGINLYLGLGLLLIGTACIVIHFLMPKLSENGREINTHLQGFRAFLADPDPDTLDELIAADAQYLNKVFPYALAFGLDKAWVERFKDTFVAPPDWYDYQGRYDHRGWHSMGHFTYMFNPYRFENVMYSVPAPQPSTNGGGNFGGGFSGGSSGGGFGGGGGSSW